MITVNTLSTEEKRNSLMSMLQEGDTYQSIDTARENQKLNTFRICGSSLVLISEIFLSFILLLIFLHSKLHGEHALEDLL